MKKYMTIILGILITALIFIGLLIWYIAYSSTSDLSQETPFKGYLNIPFIVKHLSSYC